ncbi:MAG: hypothetical protein M3460_15680 [Actinomycetota bacterium]|nr:hypothetical protein [Actinomycetota bacterium]
MPPTIRVYPVLFGVTSSIAAPAVIPRPDSGEGLSNNPLTRLIHPSDDKPDTRSPRLTADTPAQPHPATRWWTGQGTSSTSE